MSQTLASPTRTIIMEPVTGVVVSDEAIEAFIRRFRELISPELEAGRLDDCFRSSTDAVYRAGDSQYARTRFREAVDFRQHFPHSATNYLPTGALLYKVFYDTVNGFGNTFGLSPHQVRAMSRDEILNFGLGRNEVLSQALFGLTTLQHSLRR